MLYNILFREIPSTIFHVLNGATIFNIYRQSQSEKLSTRCNQLQEKLNMAISTLQQALGGINSQVSDSVAKVDLI